MGAGFFSRKVVPLPQGMGRQGGGSKMSYQSQNRWREVWFWAGQRIAPPTRQ